MRVAPVGFQTFGAKKDNKGLIYIKPIKSNATQTGIINKALDELIDVEFDKKDISYMHSMGIRPPFKNGIEALNYLAKNNIQIQYGKFSDKKVHACLSRDDDGKKTILINARYKNSKSEPEILATAEAIMHEAGHAKDDDDFNSIQEELDDLSLNVLTHRAFEKKKPRIFDNCHSFLFSEGVSLYPKLFFDDDPNKTKLKKRVADKYGHMPAGDDRHPASLMAMQIKGLDLRA